MLDLTLGIDPSQLRSAATWADNAYSSCTICPENCGVDRHKGELGFCGLGKDAHVYKEYLHFGEEEVLTPSHTIFLSGCNFRCAFCSDLAPVKEPLKHGMTVEPKVLAQRIAKRRNQGATNVNFVGGLPDVNLLFILNTLTHCPPDTHVVFNTNLWTTSEVMTKLDGIVGTWLVDYKFGSDKCARKLAGVSGYTAHINRLLEQLRDSNRGNLLLRHLIMPGHFDCCTVPVFEWLHQHLPNAMLNIMSAYSPFAMAGSKGPMSKGPIREDVNKSRRLADELGLRYMFDGR